MGSCWDRHNHALQVLSFLAQNNPSSSLLVCTCKAEANFNCCYSSVWFFFSWQSSCFWNVRRLPELSIFLLEGDSGWICSQFQMGLCWPLIRVWADGGRGETLSWHSWQTREHRGNWALRLRAEQLHITLPGVQSNLCAYVCICLLMCVWAPLCVLTTSSNLFSVGPLWKFFFFKSS